MKLTTVSAAEVKVLVEKFLRLPKDVIDAVEKAGLTREHTAGDLPPLTARELIHLS
jgi:hypothetical protein